MSAKTLARGRCEWWSGRGKRRCGRCGHEQRHRRVHDILAVKGKGDVGGTAQIGGGGREEIQASGPDE